MTAPLITPAGSTRRWRLTRQAVLARDHWHCTTCHHPVHPQCNPTGCDRCAHVDHRLARARGGSDHPANLTTLCRLCNLTKGSTVGARTQPIPTVRSRVW